MRVAASRGKLCLVTLGFAIAIEAAAPAVPQFTGTYDVQNVRPQPPGNLRVPDPPKDGEIQLPPDFRPQVTLQLRLTVNNPLDIDLKSATLELQDTQSVLRKHATFPNIHFNRKDQASVVADLQMPQPEYDAWQEGEAPNVFIIFTDAQGRLRRQKVWLTAAPAGKGNN